MPDLMSAALKKVADQKSGMCLFMHATLVKVGNHDKSDCHHASIAGYYC
jgi:hypothetical protein